MLLHEAPGFCPRVLRRLALRAGAQPSTADTLRMSGLSCEREKDGKKRMRVENHAKARIIRFSNLRSSMIPFSNLRTRSLPCNKRFLGQNLSCSRVCWHPRRWWILFNHVS